MEFKLSLRSVFTSVEKRVRAKLMNKREYVSECMYKEGIE